MVLFTATAAAQTRLSFNSPYEDYSPTITADGKRLYFTSDRPGGRGGLDIWYSEWKSGEWGPAINCGPNINTSLDEAACSTTADGKELVFTECNRGDGYGSCDIYVSRLQPDENWSRPENLGPKINTQFWESFPSISRDGRTLYFCSDRPGGKGQSDIFVSFKNDDGEWTTPGNVSELNTAGFEYSPFIAADDSTLYFSSNGINEDRSDLEIYMSRRENGRWTKPVALASLNTPDDDYFLTLPASQDRAYLTRPTSETKNDIFELPLPLEFRPMRAFAVATGRVLDKQTASPLTAQIAIENAETGEPVASISSNELTGEYSVVLPRGRTYRFTISAREYYIQFVAIAVSDSSPERIVRDLLLPRLQLGRPYIVADAFQRESDSLTPDGRTEIRRLSLMMDRNATLQGAIFMTNEADTGSDSLLRERRLECLKRLLKVAPGGMASIEWKSQPFRLDAAEAKHNYLVFVPTLN